MNAQVLSMQEIDTRISDLEKSLSMLKHQLMLQEVCQQPDESENLEFYFKQVDSKCDNFHSFCSDIMGEMQVLLNSRLVKEIA